MWITVVDRRNSRDTRRSKHRVMLVRETRDTVVFLADWKFPVPASRRRYFSGARELAVEECGKVTRQNIFQFAGLFVRQFVSFNENRPSVGQITGTLFGYKPTECTTHAMLH